VAADFDDWIDQPIAVEFVDEGRGQRASADPLHVGGRRRERASRSYEELTSKYLFCRNPFLGVADTQSLRTTERSDGPTLTYRSM
jgi:hypothetical protein